MLFLWPPPPTYYYLTAIISQMPFLFFSFSIPFISSQYQYQYHCININNLMNLNLSLSLFYFIYSIINNNNKIINKNVLLSENSENTKNLLIGSKTCLLSFFCFWRATSMRHVFVFSLSLLSLP